MQVTAGPLDRLLTLVDARAGAEGRTDSPYPGLRYYRFSQPTQYQKTQILVPGVVIVLQGAKSVYLHGRSLRYARGDCLVLGAAAVCHGTVVEAAPQQPYLAIHLDLPPAMLVKTLLAIPEADAATPSDAARQYVAPADNFLIDALLRLLPATDLALDRATLAPLAVEEIVVRLLRSEAAGAIRQAAATTRAAARIQNAMSFIHAELHRPLTVADMAAHVAMSPSHFAHSFRDVAGVTPMRYLRDARLDAARALLLGSAARPAQAAAQAGFEDLAHFSRAFRRRFDASPAEYAERMSQQF